MVKFNSVSLPLVEGIDKIKRQIYVERPIPGGRFSSREIVGSLGRELVVRGTISSDLSSAVSSLGALADGQAHELDLEDGSDSMYALAIEPTFRQVSATAIEYEIKFAETSFLELESLVDQVAVAEVLTKLIGRQFLLADAPGTAELLTAYKGQKFGETSSGSTSYPTTNLGNSNAQSSATNLQGYVLAQKITTGTDPITINKILLYCAAACNCRVALYDHDSGNNRPGNLLVESGSEACSASTWHEFTITATDLAANTTYWIGFQTDSSSSIFRYDTDGSYDRYYKSQSYGSFPNPAGSGTVDHYKFSVYAQGYKIRGIVKAVKITVGTSGAVTSISFYAHLSATAKIRLGVYDNASSKALKWEIGPVTVSPGWNIFLISDGNPTSLTLSSGTYHLVWQFNDNTLLPSYIAGSAGDGWYKVQSFGAFPVTLSGENSSSEKWAIYLTMWQIV